MAANKNPTRKTGKTRRYIGKPSAVIQQRVQEIGPQNFGIISVDCAKRRSKWMFCDYFGRVLIKPRLLNIIPAC